MFSTQAMLPETIDYTRINDIYDRFGPTPRLCIDYSFDLDMLVEHERKVNKVVSNVTAVQLEQLFKDAGSLDMDTVSHTICLISREQRDDMHSGVVVAPITSSIRSILVKQVRSIERAEQIRLYKLFAKVPGSRAVAGIFFEALAQRYLQEGTVLELIPMVRLKPGQKKKSDSADDEKKPQWYSSHLFLDNVSLEASRQEALEQVLTINIYPSETLEFTEDGPSHIIPDVFYVPEVTNHEALDSFLLLDGCLYIFQFTIGKNHGIKPGLIRFLEKCPGVPLMKDWRFLFVIEPILTLVCPQPWLLKMHELHLYSAVLLEDM